MAARTIPIRKEDVGARVDGKTVILVVHSGAPDVDAFRASNIEGVRVVRTCCVACRIVNGDIVYLEMVATVDTEGLDRGVFDCETLDGALIEVVRSEKLGFVLPPLLP